MEVEAVVPDISNVSMPIKEPQSEYEIVDGVLKEELDYNSNIERYSNSEISPLGLIGSTDRRVRVTDTTTFPHRAITYLYVRWPNGEANRCTGFIINTNTVVTAGHCVYSHTKGGWATRITVRPGANGADNFPYGAFESTKLFSVKGFTENEVESNDYGAIKISGSFPASIGSFGYGVATESNFGGEFARVTGYPTDANKPLYTQWMHSGTIDLSILGFAFHDADTTGGQSGSPMYLKENNIARAIHTGDGKPKNVGVRITSGVFENLQLWANQ
ncbi:MAG TPA: serine protease [Niallia sp.]|nr:serine protease [Niallia sp.]